MQNALCSEDAGYSEDTDDDPESRLLEDSGDEYVPSPRFSSSSSDSENVSSYECIN